MKKEEAIILVRDTFESEFNRQRFVKFIKELLNSYEEAEITRTGNYIPDAFEEYISKYDRLGKYIDNDGKRIDILIVYLKRATSIERARSMLRNFVAGYLQGRYGTDSEKDAALVAFVSPEGEDWRFSLVKLETTLKDDSRGGLKPIDEFTPAKRWSYLVGKNEKSHTAQSRLAFIIAEDQRNPTLEQLEEAFNVEIVTKQFFIEYRDLFIRAKEELDKVVASNPKVKVDFEGKGIDTVNLAKKLLGQITFLYFLQKKGWFGVPRDATWGEGSKFFLRELFDKKHCVYKNFFNDILEPLFYEALRIDRSFDDNYYSRFNCKIPFLNGGLFDPMNNYDWVHADILLPNDLFSNNKRISGVDKGDGILDIFDRYNFTVKEDEPLEKEVAIDPELLGKTYEKFNAIRLDNYGEYLKALKGGQKGEEGKFNKQFGVYYTPREIVHYMCQQSLINYLAIGVNGKIDQEDLEALVLHGEQIQENDERVIAVGHETRDYFYLMPGSVRNNAVILDEELSKIKVCDPASGSGAFPVGMMSEIVKARQVLGIYINSNRTSYSLKRECIENSLYGVDIDAGAVEIAKLRLWLSLVVDEDDPQNIKPLPNLDYKIVNGDSLTGVEENLFNTNLFAELERLKPLYFNSTNPIEKQEYKRRIDGLIDQITDGRAHFDFNIYFSEVFHEKEGFDIVIGNPPYIQLQTMHKKADVLQKQGFKTFIRTGDIYCLFYEKGIQLLREKGILVFITSNKWMRAGYGEALRNFFAEKTNPLVLVDFSGQKIFESATVDVNILIIEKTGNKNRTKSCVISELSSLNNLSVFIEQNSTDNNFSISSSWSILSDIEHKIKGKIEEIGIPLKDWNIQINYGIKTGLNEAFIISGEKKNELVTADPKSAEIIRPILRGRDIKRYGYHFSDIWLINTHNGIVNNGIPRVDVNNYPAIKAHLDNYLYELKKRYDKGDTPYNLRSCDYMDDFYKQKIVWGNLNLSAQFAMLEEGIFINAPSSMIVPGNEYLLAVLNSKLADFYIRNLGVTRNGGYFEYKPMFIEQLPVPKLSLKEQEPFASLVSLPNQENQLEIDSLVYKIYKLSAEEITFINSLA
jgi:hypothetical protein